nr:EOG090X0205 [Triops cancriformis]
METIKPIASKLFVTSSVEGKDDWDERYEKCYGLLQSMTNGLSEKEAHDALTSAVCKDAKLHDEVTMGFLFSILTDPPSAARSYCEFNLVSRDGYSPLINHATQLIVEKYIRLLETPRVQLLWLVKELVRNSAVGTDGLVWNLMRQVAGGDVTPKNLWLADNLIDVFLEHRTWLDKYPILIASVVYTYLRLLEDHVAPGLAALKQKEVTLVAALLREKFADCLVIGRDLVRLLQNVARIPELEGVWRDLLHNPKVLAPNFTGVLQLMQVRTSRRFLQARLTPDMEKKLGFLTSQVRFGYQKRYQDWFTRQYLSTMESQSLRCDLIRFIVGVIHPSNELLCSDIIPRWAVIGWLLTTCTSNVAAANAKLALFYDWFFYDPEKDNIMNIEPAILVMYHSMRPHPAITATLLDFLCRIIPSFYPPYTAQVRGGVVTSLRQILEKRVLPSLSPLFDSTKLDHDLRSLLLETLPEFCNTESSFREERLHLNEDGLDNIETLDNHVKREDEPVFSDEEDPDDIPLAKVRLKDKNISSTNSQPLPTDIAQHLEELDSPLKTQMEQLYHEQDNEAKCAAVESFVQLVTTEPPESETMTVLAQILCIMFASQFETKLFKADATPEAIEDSISRPMFVLFRAASEMMEDEAGKTVMLDLIWEMKQIRPVVGYYLLYYLKASQADEIKWSVYKELCGKSSDPFGTVILDDFKRCMEDDISLMVYLTPALFQNFPTVCRGNPALIHTLVFSIDASQLHQLMCLVAQGSLVLVGTEHAPFFKLVEESLNWETWEQLCLWHLLRSHGCSLPTNMFTPVLSILQSPQHTEALSALLIKFSHEKPTSDLVQALLARELKSHDLLTSSLLSYWSRDNTYSTALAQALVSQLNISVANALPIQTSPTKRKRGTANSNQKNATNNSTPGPGVDVLGERMLGHLDALRLCVSSHPKSIFNQDSVQTALQQMQAVCTDVQKKKFSDLFALAESEEASEVGAVGSVSNSRSTKNSTRGRKGGRGTGRGKAVVKHDSESSEESSEEEVVKPRLPKKRRKLMGSDSD